MRPPVRTARRSAVVPAVVMAVCVALAVSCSDGDGSSTATPSSAAVDSVDVTVQDDDVGEFVVDTDAPVVATPTTAGPATDATTTIAIVPDTGVPGIDSDDAFCRAWSEFAGSFQLLGLVSAVGDPDAARRLEVLAAPAIAAAVGALDEHLPPELAGQRDAFVDGFAGPMARRAAIAIDELDRVGLDTAAAPDGVLRSAWLDGLVAAGVDDPAPSIDVPADVDAAAFAVAVDAVAARLPAIVEDPGLVTDVDVSPTLDHIDTTCPDQGILGGNDIVS